MDDDGIDKFEICTSRILDKVENEEEKASDAEENGKIIKQKIIISVEIEKRLYRQYEERIRKTLSNPYLMLKAKLESFLKGENWINKYEYIQYGLDKGWIEKPTKG